MSGINTSDMTSCPMHYFQRQTHIHQCNASKRPQSEKRDAIIFTQTYTVKKKKKIIGVCSKISRYFLVIICKMYNRFLSGRNF